VPYRGPLTDILWLGPADHHDQGFSGPSHISYRGVKLPGISAAFGEFYLRHGADLPQMGVRYSASVIVSVIGVPTAPCRRIVRRRGIVSWSRRVVESYGE
jgi:hypothetical protein